jgi:hypothetical protein
MVAAIERLWCDEQGQDLLEFTLLAAFVALGSSLLLTPSLWRSVNSLLGPANTSGN